MPYHCGERQELHVDITRIIVCLNSDKLMFPALQSFCVDRELPNVHQAFLQKSLSITSSLPKVTTCTRFIAKVVVARSSGKSNVAKSNRLSPLSPQQLDIPPALTRYAGTCVTLPCPLIPSSYRKSRLSATRQFPQMIGETPCNQQR